ncbi:tetratricopeptide repeat protein [Cohnella terricola]|uniref:Tetratricopeptide repeat protein n=2 Tax=Cohnella terricola TaxID=1289167 RepID=A0A559JJ51_9BACL|nr:tetratricopeptide repeat protein [Cohnella terricola]
MLQVEAIYNDYTARIDIRNWEKLLQEDVIWDMKQRYAVSGRLLEYLNTHCYLPKPIWKLLIEMMFQWTESQPQELQNQYPQVYAFAFDSLNAAAYMGYSALLQASMNYDTYLRHRDMAWRALYSQEWHEAFIALGNALKLYDGDPDLIRLCIEYAWKRNRLNDAMQWCNRLVELAPEQLEGYLQRARVAFRLGKHEEALKDLTYVLGQEPTRIEALSYAGHCYSQMGQYEQAEEMFRSILSMNENDADAFLSLTELNGKLRESIKNKRMPGKKAYLQRLNQELGRQPFRTRLNQGVRMLISRRWLNIAFIIFMHFWVYHSFMKEAGVSGPFAYIADAASVSKVIVASPDKLETLPPGVQKVRLQVTKAYFTGFEQYYDKNSKTVFYLATAEAEKRGIVDSNTGYVCVGLLGEQVIYIVTSYEKALEMYNNHTAEVDGYIHSEVPSELKKVSASNVSLKSSASYPDRYLDWKHQQTRSDPKHVPFISFLYTLILVLGYLRLYRLYLKIVNYIKYI